MSKGPLVLVVMIDALGHRLVRENAFLHGLVGESRPVRTVFGYSSSAIPSLFTGADPSQHGHFAMYRRDGEGSLFREDRWLIRILGQWLGRKGYMQRSVSARLKRRGITGYFSLYEIPPGLLTEFDLCQRRNLFRPGAIDGHPSVFDDLAERGIPHRVWDWSVPEERGMEEAREAVREGRARFLLYYTAAMDGMMHVHGTRSGPTREKLRQLDGFIRDLVAAGEHRYDGVRLFVFGDHGMADVVAEHDLWSKLPPPGPPGRRGVLYFLDSTLARFWFDDPERRRPIEDLLAGESYGRCLTVEEEKGLGVHFPDRRYGELMFVAKEGHCLVPSFMGRESVAGMHGYHPDDPDSYTTLLTNTGVPAPDDVRGLARILKDEVLALGRGGA